MLNFANVAFSIHGSDSFMLVCTAASWCKIDPKHKTGYIIHKLSFLFELNNHSYCKKENDKHNVYFGQLQLYINNIIDEKH